MPAKLQSMDQALRLAGFGPQVDEFVVSMNRAAEQAAPLAKPIFQDAVANMSFGDAKQILNGGNTAATDYFKEKTRGQLATAFKPEVEKAMSQAGATTRYKELVGQYTSLPFVKVPSFNLDDYVVGKSLDGDVLYPGARGTKGTNESRSPSHRFAERGIWKMIPSSTLPSPRYYKGA